MTRRTEKPVEATTGIGWVENGGEQVASARYAVTLRYRRIDRSTADPVQGFTVTGFVTVLEGEADLGRLQAPALHLDERRWMSMLILKGDAASGSWHFTLGTGDAGGFG